MSTTKLFVMIGGNTALLIGFWGILRADLPGHSYTLALGPGNEDAKRVIESHIIRRGQFGTDFQKAYQALAPAEILNRDFRGAVFHLRLGTVCKIKFDGCDFTDADFEESYFVGCSFRGAILRNTRYFPADRDCDLTDADIQGAELFFIHKDQIASTKNYKQKDLSHISFHGNLSGLSFRGFNLRGATLPGRIRNCDFTNADIRGCSFVGPSDPDYFIKPVTQHKIHVVITPQQLYSTASYRNRDLSGVGFSSCDLRGFDFSGQSLGSFAGCDLREASFEDAWFADGPYYDGYRSTGFSRCILSKEQFYSTRNYKFKKFPSGFRLMYMDLRGWDFSGLNLWGVDFRGSDLTGARLEDAEGGDFRFAKGMTVEQVRSLKLYKERRFGLLKIPPELAEKLKPEFERLRRRKRKISSLGPPFPEKYVFGRPLTQPGRGVLPAGFIRFWEGPIGP